jgi:hypothetical protein
MKTLKNLWYHQQIDDGRKTAQKMFDDNKTNYDTYDSKKKFEDEMDNKVKKKLGKYYIEETVKSNYDEIKKPLLNKFNEGLLANKLEKLEQELKKKKPKEFFSCIL